MRILLVGASGTVGRAVAAALGERHEVIGAGRSSGEVRLDLTDEASIRGAFEEVGELDAVVCAAGNVVFRPLAELGDAELRVGLEDKLLGQVRLVRVGREFVRDGGSFTLIGGVLDREPIVAGCSASMVNGALNAFVMAAAIELERGLRINVVSPGLLEEAVEAYGDFFPGFVPVSSARTAQAFVRSVEGRITGQVLRVG